MQSSVPIWKTAPFVRLLPAWILGIIVQQQFNLSLTIVWMCIAISITCIGIIHQLALHQRYYLSTVLGVFIFLIMICVGMLFTYFQDCRNAPHWFANENFKSNYVCAKIIDEPVEKAKTYKATARVLAIDQKGKAIVASGNIVLYFSKTNTALPVQYGDEIVLRNKVTSIKNSSNPGAFNYQQFAAFQQIHHVAFLRSTDYILTKNRSPNLLQKFIYSTRNNVLFQLHRYIDSTNAILGIAEALLIGYTQDLDKDLVQAYSNTGVVHIIAISGMHLGLIYLILEMLLTQIAFFKKHKGVKLFVLLAALWLFALLTGASASVLRAAVMFSFMLTGKWLQKRHSIYNALAASAFILLAYNPFMLWDVGFQLSYAAVLSIVVFQRPIEQLWYIKNTWLDKVWQLIAVSIAAQILTVPLCVFYFHQFPNLFLVTNIVAVPLSSLLLLLEIVLVTLAWLPAVAIWLGKICSILIHWMNIFIQSINTIPWSTYNNIPANFYTTIVFYAILIAGAYAIFNKHTKALMITFFGWGVFTALHSFYEIEAIHQKKIIVYQVNGKKAVDLIWGKQLVFIGDSSFKNKAMDAIFNLKPTRILYRVNQLQPAIINPFYYQFYKKKMLFIEQSIAFKTPTRKINIDLIVISHNANLSIANLAATFNNPLIVMDASNSKWKIEQWQKACNELHLQSWAVPEKGALVIDAQ
jgi:competence protein ComEC